MQDLDAEQVGDLRREVDEQWEAAVRRGPTTDADKSIGGRDVRLRVVGDELAASCSPRSPTIRPQPARPTSWSAHGPRRGELPLRHTDDQIGLERWVVRRGDEVVAQLEGQSDHPTIRVADHLARRYLLGVEGVANLPWWEGGAPFRRQLHWALAPDALPVHAAAVGDARGAALLVGRGGSGKSSTAVACLAAGLGFLGDDYCILRFEPEPVVHSLYCSAKVTNEELPHLGALAEQRDLDVPEGPKPVLFPLRTAPSSRCSRRRSVWCSFRRSSRAPGIPCSNRCRRGRRCGRSPRARWCSSTSTRRASSACFGASSVRSPRSDCCSARTGRRTPQ